MLGIAPSEIGVGLGESDLGQAVHHFRPREGLGQEDHVGVPPTDVADQPFPERQWLGVWIVDAEDPDAVLDPEEDDVPQRGPQLRQSGAVGIEFDIDDVLVLLRRVLGKPD